MGDEWPIEEWPEEACPRCSIHLHTAVLHGEKCPNDPGAPVNVIAAHFKTKNPAYCGIVWEAIANGALRALEDAGWELVRR